MNHPGKDCKSYVGATLFLFDTNIPIARSTSRVMTLLIRPVFPSPQVSRQLILLIVTHINESNSVHSMSISKVHRANSTQGTYYPLTSSQSVDAIISLQPSNISCSLFKLRPIAVKESFPNANLTGNRRPSQRPVLVNASKRTRAPFTGSPGCLKLYAASPSRVCRVLTSSSRILLLATIL